MSALVERHHRAVFRFCRRMVGPQRAEDLCQDTFIRAVRGIRGFRGRASFRSWLFTVARNACIDDGRKRAYRKTESLDHASHPGGAPRVESVPASGARPEQEVQRAQLREALSRAVDGLPEEQREVFLLREDAGLSFKEIAEVTRVPENTAKSRMRYALEGLRRALTAAGWEAP
jgi:RNA polymerase sigma-70 factor (ECF subfamily)